MYSEKRKVFKSGSSLAITINTNGLDVKKGDEVKVTFENGKMIVEVIK